jgi:peptide/nickel transport system substrate-binding protein
MKFIPTTLRACLCSAILLSLLSCSKHTDPNTLVMIIESSPTNLDPRIGQDAQSQRIDGLIFDNLLTRDEHLNAAPGIATSWDIPDPLTYIFHLRTGVKFHDGQPLTSRDVKWSFDSLMQGKVRSSKGATFRVVDRIDAPDDATVVFHLKEPSSTLLWNLASAAMGIVPFGSGEEISQHPIGSGPFRFVSAELDKEVVLEGNPDYWGDKPHLARVRLTVVPDTTTRALELRKGSADITPSNSLTSDMVLSLKQDPSLEVLSPPGTVLAYMGFNLHDPILKDRRVRQALAYAMDRKPLIHYLWRDFARPANSVLPPESWAYCDTGSYDYDPEQARKLLDDAGYPVRDGVRFHLAMKTSTEESSRLMASVFQQQLRDVGIVLDIRTFEFATFFADVTHGEFQMYSLRWVGGNEDPDIFDLVFHSSRFPPNGSNRGYYSNPRVDTLIDQGRREIDQGKRKQIYAELQKILAEDLPYINLWYFDNVLIHSKRVHRMKLDPSGSYDFLKTATLQ